MPYKDPDKRREYARRWRENNPDYARQWHLDNPDKEGEYQRQYCANNAAKKRASRQQYYEANVDKVNEANRKWYEDNRAAVLDKQRQWRKDNPDRAAAKWARRRARKAGATIGDPTAIAAREAEIRESCWCVWCQAKVDDLHVDHIWPLSKGGPHSVENLQGLCAKHNLKKGDKLLPQLEAGNGCRG